MTIRVLVLDVATAVVLRARTCGQGNAYCRVITVSTVVINPASNIHYASKQLVLSKYHKDIVLYFSKFNSFDLVNISLAFDY